MKVDPRFSLSVEGRDGQKVLRAFAAADAPIGGTATPLFEASFGELCDLAEVGAKERLAFEARDRTIFCNGWQSWSFGGELAAGERVRRARIVPNIAVFCDGPGPLEARGEVLSRFIAYVRAGEGRLVVASVGSPGKATPPVAFRIRPIVARDPRRAEREGRPIRGGGAGRGAPALLSRRLLRGQGRASRGLSRITATSSAWPSWAPTGPWCRAAMNPGTTTTRASTTRSSSAISRRSARTTI